MATKYSQTLHNQALIVYFSEEVTMSEADLNTYKLQLQQVEAALTTDPDNEVKISSIIKYSESSSVFNTALSP